VNRRLKRALVGVCGPGGALRDLVSRVLDWAREWSVLLGCLAMLLLVALLIALLAALYLGDLGKGIASGAMFLILLVLLCAVMGGS